MDLYVLGFIITIVSSGSTNSKVITSISGSTTTTTAGTAATTGNAITNPGTMSTTLYGYLYYYYCLYEYTTLTVNHLVFGCQAASSHQYLA